MHWDCTWQTSWYQGKDVVGRELSGELEWYAEDTQEPVEENTAIIRVRDREPECLVEVLEIEGGPCVRRDKSVELVVERRVIVLIE